LSFQATSHTLRAKAIWNRGGYKRELNPRWKFTTDETYLLDFAQRMEENTVKGIHKWSKGCQMAHCTISTLRNILMGATGLLLLAGCAHTPGGIAPSNIPIEGRKYKVVGSARATDSVVRLFGIIPLSGSNSIRVPMNDCIRSRQGDAMIGITSESYSQYWILFTRQTIVVQGDVIKFEKELGSTP